MSINKYNAFYHYNIIEITGISAIGKSTYIKENCVDNDKILFDVEGFSNATTGYFIYRFFLASRLFFQSIFLSSISFSDIFWIFKATVNIRCSLLFRVNIFRNCLLKFYHYDLLSKSEKHCKTLFIDEGISHIPFLIQDQNNGKEMIKEFYIRFQKQLSFIKVVCIDGDVNTVERLLLRGHKRLKHSSKHEAKRFDAMNRSTLEDVLKYADFYKKFTIILTE